MLDKEIIPLDAPAKEVLKSTYERFFAPMNTSMELQLWLDEEDCVPRILLDPLGFLRFRVGVHEASKNVK